MDRRTGDSRVPNDIDAELEFHFAETVEALIEQGLTREAATTEAHRRFGDREHYGLALENIGRMAARRRLTMTVDARRRLRILTPLESIVADVRFAVRLLRKNAVVTVAAVLSLSLAIGACVGSFSLIDALILRPLPVSDPQRLVHLTMASPDDADESAIFNYPLFVRMRDTIRGRLQLVAISFQSRRDAMFEDAGGQVEKVYAQWISGDAFPMLGVRPALGRLLLPSDDVKPGQHPVAVISYDFWTRRFGRDPTVLGRWVTIKEKPLQIVGVTEQRFTGVEPGTMTDLWAPTMMWDDGAIVQPGWSWHRIWGRVQPGASRKEARELLQAVSVNFRRERVATRRGDEPRDQVERYVNARVQLQSAANGPSSLRQNFGRALWLVGLIAALVLLIACSNIASLLVARGAAREREMAVRISIGAGRGRLIQQLLIESTLLAIAACAIGSVLALYAAAQVTSLLSTSTSIIRLDVRFDWRMLAFVAGAGSVVTCLFGLGPALRASSVSPNAALKSGSTRQSARIGVFRPLVAAQTAFSFVVLFVGGLFLVSFANLTRTNLGFDRHDLVIAAVESKELAQSGSEAFAFWRQLLERLEESPGVQSASVSGWGLFEGSTSSRSVRVPGRPVEAFEPFYLPVSPGFLKTMRIELIDGRDVEWRDVQRHGDARVIVNESFVRRYFPDGAALGKRFFHVGVKNDLISQEIVGIVRDAKYASVRAAAPPTVYLPQWPPGWGAVQVRTSLESPAVAALMREQLRRVHPGFRLTDMALQSTLVDDTLVRERALALLSAFFVAVAVVLVAVGLYGVLSYGVESRTREIGIRLALGARPSSVVLFVVGEIAGVVAIGLVVGVALGLTASQFTTRLLYQVEASDLWSLGLPLACLFVTCALSALRPALRATHVDPMTALRNP